MHGSPHFKNIFLALTVLFIPSLVEAQSSDNSSSSAYPQSLMCVQTENFGSVTAESVEHSHSILLNFNRQSNGTYIYIGTTKNSEDNGDGSDGGGESASAVYNIATDQIISTTNGIVCPAMLAP